MRKTNNFNTNSILFCMKIKALIKQSLMRKKVKTLKKQFFGAFLTLLFEKKVKQRLKCI
jgi:hypothetical protein